MAGRILVTGGAGYVGSHCCRAFAAAGFEPVVYDDLSTGHRDLVKWGPLVEGDVCDGAALDAAFAAHRPVLVAHFAALSLVAESVADPGRYWRVNAGGTLALLQAMRRHGVAGLVFSSTAAVYGTSAGGAALTEDAPLAPISPYGASKLAAERMMEDFDAAHGLRSVRLRYFNACGAEPEAGIGEDHSPETHLVPILLDVAAGRRARFSVYGTDYPTPDGTAIRDYVHVLDLADAHVAAARHLAAGGGALALNLGTGRGRSVAEMVAAAARVTGREIATEQAPRRAGDPPVLVADPARARAVLGWQAVRSEPDTILADAWEWHRRRFG